MKQFFSSAGFATRVKAKPVPRDAVQVLVVTCLTFALVSTALLLPNWLRLWTRTNLSSSIGTRLLRSELIKSNSAMPPLYVSIIAAPYTGSSALSGLLSTSPLVDCLSKSKTWQNEGTWLLTRVPVVDGGIPEKRRWDPQFPRDWNKAYEVYHQFWNKTNATILVDKSPPNLAKCRQLLQFYSTLANNARGVFIILIRIPCSIKWYEGGRRERIEMFESCVGEIPVSKRLIVWYEDLILHTEKTVKLIEDFLSRHAEYSVHLNASKGSGTRGDRGLSISQYKQSQTCKLGFLQTMQSKQNYVLYRRLTKIWSTACAKNSDTNCFHKDTWNFSIIEQCPDDRLCSDDPELEHGG